jgi:hypothetical protein
LAVVLALLGIAAVWLARPERGGDTGPLLTGTEALGRCLTELDLVSCSDPAPIGPYPLLQYVPDLLSYWAGLSVDGRVRMLALLSVLGVVAAVAAGWVVLRRVGCPEWRWGLLVVAVSGPVIAYGNTTWGEMLATGLVTLLVAAALVPARPALVGLAAFGASVTKETGYPFVVALGLIALALARRRTGAPIIRHAMLGAAGIALAVAASSALNMIRFGTPRNAYYLDPGLRTTTVERFFELSAGLVVAPNGGILFFWPLAVVIVGLLVVIPTVGVVRRAWSWRDAWPAVALAVVIAALVAGLASWWAPFGWWAWGPRLSLPWMLPVVLLALGGYGSSLTPWAARVLAPISGLVVSLTVAVLVALPHVGVLWRPETIGDFFFHTTTAVCPGGGPPPTPAYYACLHEQMWEREPILVDALEGLRSAGGLITAVLVTIVLVGCLVQLRREAIVAVSTRRGPSAPRGSSAR